MRGPLNIIEGMHCDGGSSVLVVGCLNPVVHGLRIHVPSRTQMAPDHDQVRITLTLHSCAEHRGTFKLDDLLVPKIKAEVEAFARVKRPIDFKPDFDAAFVQYVDVFGPEYRQFMMATEHHAQAAAEQLWGAPIHG